MIHVGMRQQHQVYRRQLIDLDTGATLPSKQDKPLRKYRIDQERAPIELQKKRRMADEGHSQAASFY